LGSVFYYLLGFYGKLVQIHGYYNFGSYKLASKTVQKEKNGNFGVVIKNSSYKICHFGLMAVGKWPVVRHDFGNGLFVQYVGIHNK